MRKNASTITVLLAAMLFGGIVLATGMGYLKISPLEVIHVLYSHLFLDSPPDGINEVFPFVILDVRLPRILIAVLVGGGLAVAGCVFQAILLNPLADPYTLGISSGAAFGAAVALILGIFGIILPAWFSVPLFAFLGAIITLYVVFAIASGDASLSSNTLILSGVIVSAILSAGIGFIKYLADEEVSVIIFWLMGSLVGSSWTDIILITLLFIPALTVIMFFARDLNIMSLGSQTSDTLGIDTPRVRKILLMSASLITAACVSVSGIIGFIGLIVPHLLRLLVGVDNRILLPACFIAGAILLLFADTITRAYLPAELPIGVLTSLIGGPFFCYIFRKKQLGAR
ncbi:MAG: iron chelate uptake ABC transporter family permease subunit [Desulfocapsaceae bacterium]|nr:iron chelate uptake ABC transporter family permease subunit [Desulfocapsaceae bacterium]